jgi:hypothetical protein
MDYSQCTYTVGTRFIPLVERAAALGDIRLTHGAKCTVTAFGLDRDIVNFKAFMAQLITLCESVVFQ